ncbi:MULTISPECIES: toxin [unclassified Bifidobacterium]|uniref:toxin n=1 Tax=unclassified Bifidobacterium TaxID=2608897 RepID=UPI0023F96C28|nr:MULTISPECIES: toxin [unclassified Bifidobacterium]WEV65891.1 toxin [Bifidobacterium sp. ESL0764]WEV75324.1 toxin [Bifidobacterium sp. ESL0800]
MSFENDENSPEASDGFMWYNIQVFPLRSAFKHGVSEEDMRHVFEHPNMVIDPKESPARKLYLGFDTIGRPLEVITMMVKGGEAIIHAMPMRKKYISGLEKGQL